MHKATMDITPKQLINSRCRIVRKQHTVFAEADNIFPLPGKLAVKINISRFFQVAFDTFQFS